MRYGLVALLCSLCFIAKAQDESNIDTTKNKSAFAKFLTPAGEFRRARVYWVTGTETVLAVGSLIALNELWYKDYPRTNFHTFNDNREWLLMDKAGHVITAYTTGWYGIKLLQWAGVKKNKAIWCGGLTGFAYLAGIEMLDAYSSAWGFSTGDMIANAAGTALLIGQEFLWQEQRIVPKFGFRPSGYAQYRPELLGSNLREQVIKDYNGQTYWLSFNLASFLPDENSFPKWRQRWECPKEKSLLQASPSCLLTSELQSVI